MCHSFFVLHLYCKSILLYKRLEDGKFSWPRNEQEVRNITREQFIWLTQGLSIDQPKAIKKVAGGVDIC